MKLIESHKITRKFDDVYLAEEKILRFGKMLKTEKSERDKG